MGHMMLEDTGFSMLEQAASYTDFCDIQGNNASDRAANMGGDLRQQPCTDLTAANIVSRTENAHATKNLANAPSETKIMEGAHWLS